MKYKHCNDKLKLVLLDIIQEEIQEETCCDMWSQEITFDYQEIVFKKYSLKPYEIKLKAVYHC